VDEQKPRTFALPQHVMEHTTHAGCCEPLHHLQQQQRQQQRQQQQALGLL
jgi:hypothetical protein